MVVRYVPGAPFLHEETLGILGPNTNDENPSKLQYMSDKQLHGTRSTIETAHFQYLFFWMTGFLNPKSSE